VSASTTLPRTSPMLVYLLSLFRSVFPFRISPRINLLLGCTISNNASSCLQKKETVGKSSSQLLLEGTWNELYINICLCCGLVMAYSSHAVTCRFKKRSRG
jgi:hypothetical protein